MLKNKVSLLTTILFFLLSALVILSSYISPQTFWPSSLLALFLIPVLLTNLIILSVFLARRSWWLIFPLFIVGSSLSFLSKLYVWSSDKEEEATEHSFSVLSYNTSFFRAGRVFSKAYYSSDNHLPALQMADWIRSNGADVICLQEFFDDENSEIFNNIQAIGDQEGYEHYFLTKPVHDNGVRRGLVTFSKFPIIGQGTIFLSENRYNGSTFVDLNVYSDTIRIINVHLESLNLSEQSQEGSIFIALKNNALRKSEQANEVIENLRKSPYPTLICGDFNETPTGFLYRQFDQLLNNAFEQGGAGFGFTYQGLLSIPLLRIDNQFYDPLIRLVSFTNYRNIRYSDHFPIEARYQIE